MNDSIMDKYYDLLLKIKEQLDSSNNAEEKAIIRDSIYNFINSLYKIENNKEVYDKTLKELGFDSKLSNNQSNILDKYSAELENILKNPNEESIKVWIKNVIMYANDNNIDFNKIKIYIKDVFGNKDNEFSSKLDTYIDEIKNTIKDIYDREEDNKSLKVINVKRSFNSQSKNKSLSLYALAGLGGIAGIILGVGAYKLYSNGVKDVKKLIEQNDLKLNEDDKLIDSVGNEISKKEVGRLKYILIKKSLSKEFDGIIDKEYKKNRLTSFLLNTPLIKKTNNKFESLEISEIEDKEEVVDINKGMRLIK